MKYKSYITRFKNKFLKKNTVVRDPQLMHPDREWAIGLFVAVLIFSLCGLWSIYAYLKNRAPSALPMEDATENVVYRESIVKEALVIIARRKTTLEQLTSQPSVPVIVEEEIATTTPPVVETEEPAEESVLDTTAPALDN